MLTALTLSLTKLQVLITLWFEKNGGFVVNKDTLLPITKLAM
jgi:hypothetical protein